MVLLNKNSFQIKIILISALFSFSLQQICVLGKNCPINQGMCVGEFCQCLNDFYSLLDPNIPPDQQIFCNYEKTNALIPLIMEILLPSTGHFYAGKYILGAFKLILLIFFSIFSYILYGTCGIPKFVINLMNFFGISPLNIINQGLKLNIEKNEKENEEKEGEDEGDNNNNQQQNNFFDITPEQKIKFKTANTQSGKARDEITRIKQVHNDDGDDVYNPNLEEPLIERENTVSEKEKEMEEEINKQIKHNPVILKLYKISLIFWLLYIFDIYAYHSNIYNDGNGVPFTQ